MLALVRRHTQDEETQLSIINDGFLKVFKSIDKYEFKGSFEGWIRRVVFNCLSDYFRKENKYLKFMVFETEEVTISTNAVHSLYYQDIIEIVDLLPEKTKKVFCKYAIEGYKHKDISDELQISVGTSKWHLSEARKQLKEIITNRNLDLRDVR